MQISVSELFSKKTAKTDKPTKQKEKPKDTKESSFKKILDKKKEENKQESHSQKDHDPSKNQVALPPPSLFSFVETTHSENMQTIKNASQILLDTMAEQITHQAKNGISTTTVTVGGDSLFSGCEIEIKLYDTAPNSFLIELRGSQNAQALFTKNLGALSSQLASVFKEYQIDLRAPKLSDYSSKKRGKGSPLFSTKRKNTRQIGKIV